MATEPERPIEKLLRAAAKKRRADAGAPLELHPATRRLLQGEVTRTFAKAARAPRSFLETLGRLWPQFAWGAAIVAMLAVAGYVLLPIANEDKQETLLAKNEPMQRAMSARPPPPPSPAAEAPALAPPAPAPVATPPAAMLAESAPPAPAAPARQLGIAQNALSKDNLSVPADQPVKEKLAGAPALQLADRQKAPEVAIAAPGEAAAPPAGGAVNGVYQYQFGIAGRPAPSANLPAPAAAPAPVPMTTAAASVVAQDESAKLASDLATQSVLAYKSLPAGAAAYRSQSLYAATDASLASANKASKKTPSFGAVQQFARVAPGTKAAGSLADKITPAHPVLAVFQVEQAGRELRIVDSDGSVYSGYVQLADAARRRPSARPEASAGTRALRAPSGAVEALPAAGLDVDQLAPQNYVFRVTGTNRSLHKKVVFTGNLLAATNLPTFQPFTNALALGSEVNGRQTASAQPNLLPLLRLRISGKVVVGNRKAVEINALPTSP